MNERLHSHYQSLEHAIDFTKVADAKAAPVVILHVALIGALAFRAGPLFNALTPFLWTGCQVSLLIAALLYISFSLGAIWFAGWVFLPKTPQTGKSLIYFEDIVAMGWESFQSQSQKLVPASIEQQLLRQIFAVSEIASAKMRQVRCALILSGVAIGLWVALLVWGIVVSSTA